MTAETQTEFKGWARVEVMGHNTHIGFVTTEVYGAAVMFRVDQPEIPEREETLACERYVRTDEWSRTLPAGAVVKHAAIPAVSVLIGSGSIYRLFPCTEEAAMAAILNDVRPALQLVRLPENLKLIEPSFDFDDEHDDGGDEVI